MKSEIEKLYPVPGIEPGPLALRASALPLHHPGPLVIQGRINLNQGEIKLQIEQSWSSIPCRSYTSILHRYVAVNTKYSFTIGHSNI